MDVADTPKILISGPPASGKGTQCELIKEKYGVAHISTGDMLRLAVRNSTELGLQAKSYMDSGALVPDHLVISLLKERIKQLDCSKNGWLLDGFPRTAVQAQALDDAGVTPSSVMTLEVKDEILIERVVGRRSDPDTGKIYHLKFNPPTDPQVNARLKQRSDDTEEKAKVRLKTYYTHAQSINDHYGSVVRRIDGNRAKEDVFKDLCLIIDTSDKNSENKDESDLPGSALSASEDKSSGKPTPKANKSIPVADFVRRAEEAYERGVLNNEDVNWSGQATADSPEDIGTSTYADLGRRFDLVIGDVLALVVFAYIGRASHGSKALDFEILKTAAPFVSAWLVCSPLLGAYTRAATVNVATTLKYFVRAWAVAVPMGIGIRGMLSTLTMQDVLLTFTESLTCPFHIDFAFLNARGCHGSRSPSHIRRCRYGFNFHIAGNMENSLC